MKTNPKSHTLNSKSEMRCDPPEAVGHRSSVIGNLSLPLLLALGFLGLTSAGATELTIKAESWDYDAIVLDVMLPHLDGWQVLHRLRESKKTPCSCSPPATPPRTACAASTTGADDYLVKPFDLDELLARLRALIRRAAGQTRNLIEVGEVVINTSARRVTRAGHPVALTAREYALVEFLALHRGEVVTRTALHEHLLDEADDTISNLLDVHVSNLRKKLGAGLVTTHRGHGYSIE